MSYTIPAIMDVIVDVVLANRDTREYAEALGVLDEPARGEAITKLTQEIAEGYTLQGIFPNSTAYLKRLVSEQLGPDFDDADFSTALGQLKRDGRLAQFGPGRGRAVALWEVDDTDAPAAVPAHPPIPLGPPATDRIDAGTGDGAGGGEVLASRPSGDWIHRTREVIKGEVTTAMTDLHQRMQVLTSEIASMRQNVNASAVESMNELMTQIQNMNEELDTVRTEFELIEELVRTQARLEDALGS